MSTVIPFTDTRDNWWSVLNEEGAIDTRR